MEDPVHAVLVVRGCKNVRDYEFAASGDDDGVVTEVRVLEENASIFFVNANGIFDRCALSCSVDECCTTGGLGVSISLSRKIGAPRAKHTM